MEIQRGFLYSEAFLCGGRVWKEGGVHLDSNVRGHVRTYVRTYVSTYERTVRTYLYATFKYVRIRTCVTICGARPSVPKKRKNKRPGGARASGPAWARGGASACPFTPVRGLLVRLSLSKWGPPLADDSCGCFLVSIVLFCVRNLDPTDVRSSGLKPLRACHPSSRPKPVHA